MVKIWSVQTFKRFPELIPVTGFVGAVCGMACAFMGYALYQKPDVVIVKSNPIQPYERLNPETPQRIFPMNQKYSRIPELEELRREIGSYKAR